MRTFELDTKAASVPRWGYGRRHSLRRHEQESRHKGCGANLVDRSCAAAAVYTSNVVKAAPLHITMEQHENRYAPRHRGQIPAMRTPARPSAMENAIGLLLSLAEALGRGRVRCGSGLHRRLRPDGPPL
jgi:hypothetical protein